MLIPMLSIFYVLQLTITCAALPKHFGSGIPKNQKTAGTTKKKIISASELVTAKLKYSM